MIPLNAASTLVDLAPDRVNHAIALSQTIDNPLTRWQSYLALLALEGFTQWISDRSTPIQYDRAQARLLEPSEFGVPAAINSVYANRFHLGFFIVEDDVDDQVEFPISLLENPAHFYIAACVHEESNQVSFHSFLRGDRVFLDSSGMISTALFETNIEQLMQCLVGLELSAISLPKASSMISAQWLVQPLINAAQWFQSQVDELAWTLFSPEVVPAGMRSRANVFNADLTSIFTEVERSGIHIPSTAQSGYRSVRLNHHTFRLYLTSWAIEETSDSEWSLLIILESIQSPTLPAGTQLIIQEGNTVLVEEEAKAESSYLVAQVIGNWNEKFTLSLRSINPENGILVDSLNLPPILFQPY